MTFTTVDVVAAPVDAPPLRPAPTSLVQAADVIDVAAGDLAAGAGEHWLNGLRWVPEGIGFGLVDICTQAMPLTGHNRTGTRIAVPFAVVTNDKCSAFSWQGSDARERARRTLLATEAHAVEAQFERGLLTSAAPAGYKLAETVNDTDGTNTKLIAGSAAQTSAVRALALLDQAIAEANIGQGMVHAAPLIVALWNAGGALRLDGNNIRTPSGNVVVSGNGYNGAGPDGSTGTNNDVTTNPTTMWAYATDLVRLFRSSTVDFVPEDLREAMERTLNDVEQWAMRAWAIQWSRNLHAAVKITV